MTGLAVLLAGSFSIADGAVVNVSMSGVAFAPQDIVVNVGDEVVWTNNDPVLHTVTSDDGTSFDSGNISPGNQFSFVFNSPGSFPYHCEIHSGMVGTVTVEAASATPVPSTGTLGMIGLFSLLLIGGVAMIYRRLGQVRAGGRRH